jgi:nucleotidyltransferase substrate binding protein (TIGR01987 family)
LSLRHYLKSSADKQGPQKDKSYPDVRWKQRFENYEKALEQLTRVVKMYPSPGFTDVERTVCIKFFEMTYELSWKVMKDYLFEKGIAGIIGSKDAVRYAVSSEIIDEGGIWMQMVDSRNEIAHTYDEGKAQALCDKIVTCYYSRLCGFAAKMRTLS